MADDRTLFCAWDLNVKCTPPSIESKQTIIELGLYLLTKFKQILLSVWGMPWLPEESSASHTATWENSLC